MAGSFDKPSFDEGFDVGKPADVRDATSSQPGPISTRAVWPATSGAAPVRVPPAGHQPDVSHEGTAEGVIQFGRVLPYPNIFAPIVIPEIPQPEDYTPDSEAWLTNGALSKFSPTWPQPYLEAKLHASLIPAAAAWNTTTPFDVNRFPHTNPSQPIFTNRLPAAVIASSGGVRVPFRLGIHPAMWQARYPDIIPQKPTRPPSRIVEPPIVILPARIKPVIPDFIWRQQPHHYLDPAWFGPDTARPNQPTEVDDSFVWFMQQPDFARGPIPLHYLAPSTVWDISYEIHGADGIPPTKKRGGLLLMGVGR